MTSKFFPALLLTTACLFQGLAQAQEFPTRPLRLIVPTSPGTGPDVLARVMGPAMGKLLGQTVITENKAGADSIIAYEYVSKIAPPDGYTIAVVNVSNLAILPLVTKGMRFDALKDLPPLIGVAKGRWIFGSSAKSPWNNFNGLVAHIRANPGKTSYGTPASTIKLLTEVLLQELKLDVTRIDYSAAASYFLGLAGGDVQMGFIAEGVANSLGERFRVLAVTGDKRAEGFPNAPTFAELGFPQMRGISYSLNVPAALPRPVFDKLYNAASQALQTAEVKKQLTTLRVELTGEPPALAAKNLADEARVYAEVAAKAGIKPM